MKVVIRVVSVVVVLGLLVAGGLWLRQRQTASQPVSAATAMTQVVAVQQGDLSASISVVGELAAVQQEDLAFTRMSGTTTLLTLAAEAGQRVEAGQALATIDPALYQQALDQALSDLRSTEARLADLKEPATALAIAQADLKVARAELSLAQAQDKLDDLLAPDIPALEADVASAQLALTKAQSDLATVQSDRSYEDRLAPLLQTEAERSAQYSRLANESYTDAYHQDRLQIAYNNLQNAIDARVTAETQRQMELLKAQMAFTRAERKLAATQEVLADTRGSSNTAALAAARQAVAQAEIDLVAARESRAALDAGADEVELAAAQADLDKKRLAVEKATLDLAGTTLAAPFSGTVLSTGASQGNLITANTRILTLADLTALEVRAAVDETTIRQVAAGQAATLTFDAFPGRTFGGAVLAVPLQGSLQGGVMVYEVPLSLEGVEGLALLVGMTANVTIAVGQAQNALLVPAMALQNLGGMYQVLVPNLDPAGEPVAVPVEVGLSDGTYTQIVRGLVPGDQVVVQLTASQSNQFDLRNIRQMLGGGAAPTGGRPGQ